MTRTQTSRGGFTSSKFSKKRAADSDDDSDRPVKKGKSAAVGGSGSVGKDGEGNEYWLLNKTGNRRITVSEFKGKTFVNIREYYEKEGEMLPGKKGIMLAPDQFSMLLSALPEIESALAEKGVSVPRPNYGQGAGKANEDDEEEDVEQAQPAKKRDKSKRDESDEEDIDEDDDD